MISGALKAMMGGASKMMFGGKRRTRMRGTRMRGGQQCANPTCNIVDGGDAPKKMHGGQCFPYCDVVKGGSPPKMHGGQCSYPDCGVIEGGSLKQKGGKHLPLNPASLSGDSFDRSGAQLANSAHALYVKQNYDLAAIKGVNAMKGGRRSRRTAKKYSHSKSRRSARSGGGLVEAVVPLGLLAAQQTLFKRGSSKRYNKYGGSRRRSRRN